MTTTPKLPGPLYAAAGAGDAVVEQLKKIPAKLDELRNKSKMDEHVEAVRDGIMDRIETLRNLDGETVKKTASDTAASLSEKAKEAREKAADTYAELVERGERVAAGERSPIRVIATITGKHDEPQTDPVEAELLPETKKPAAKKATRKPAAKKATAKK
ncbi:hypothetical protein [Stackebrandtia soli]|uniref:hypothetical protein n=1 Tax=Stackebrandtia soli TaxID=1892856 RepID=UPI0039EC27E1